MVTEHALLHVIPGREAEFEIAFGEARAIITSMSRVPERVAVAFD